jgi:hypothetical protein
MNSVNATLALSLTLEIMETLANQLISNEELEKVIRHEKTDSKTNKVTIIIGALVKENMLSSCAGEKRKLTVEAGTTFSGREYEISRIKK